VKLPLGLIDYVIAHELCHLTEFNHGPKFYRLLEYAMPDWKTREQLLKQF
jgi:predicted metal-dependent hydrolase